MRFQLERGHGSLPTAFRGTLACSARSGWCATGISAASVRPDRRVELDRGRRLTEVFGPFRSPRLQFVAGARLLSSTPA
jgi:hypothetical protein